MGERIKKLRKALGLTQHEFADKLGISRGNIGSYEVGKSNLGGSVISLICKTFNVNELWLRTGEGEMFVRLTRDQEISDFVFSLFEDESESFKRRFISVLSRLNESEWAVLEKMAEAMCKDEQ